eukprot:10087918-Alexandrium_andersonii.AAC.1
MSASLVGSEMCIRDSFLPPFWGMRVVAEPVAANVRIADVNTDMARALDCTMAPWGLRDAALADTSESVVPVACNSVALAEGDE